MAFQQGLSGLNVSSKAIDVTSHNIANSATVGYKTSRAHFGDMYANSLGIASANQVGIGANLLAVQQDFNQGNTTSTSNSLDLAINGGGFFRVLDYNGSVSYTRNGQFHLNNEGYVVNDQGYFLTGFPAVNGVIQSVTPQEIHVSNANIPPMATGKNGAANKNGVAAGLNLDSRATLPAATWTTGATTNPDGTVTITQGTWSPNVNTYNETTSVDVYDSLGNAHTLSFYFVKNQATNSWQVHANVDNTSDAFVTGFPKIIAFNQNGEMQTAMPFDVSIDLAGINKALGLPDNGATTPLTFPVDFSGTTQFASNFTINSLSQDGYASGYITGLSVSEDGIVLGNYSNGQSFSLGQVALASFMNPNGLEAVGGNQWRETIASGAPLLGKPQSSNLGLIKSSMIEESNVDLTNELVNLITFQRNYQANAQSIQTQDQIMQTIVNLR